MTIGAGRKKITENADPEMYLRDFEKKTLNKFQTKWQTKEIDNDVGKLYKSKKPTKMKIKSTKKNGMKEIKLN